MHAPLLVPSDRHFPFGVALVATKISVGFVTIVFHTIQKGWSPAGWFIRVGWLLPSARLYLSLSLNASSMCESFFQEGDARGLDG